MKIKEVWWFDFFENYSDILISVINNHMSKNRKSQRAYTFFNLFGSPVEQILFVWLFHNTSWFESNTIRYPVSSIFKEAYQCKGNFKKIIKWWQASVFVNKHWKQCYIIDLFMICKVREMSFKISHKMLILIELKKTLMHSQTQLWRSWL